MIRPTADSGNPWHRKKQSAYGICFQTCFRHLNTGIWPSALLITDHPAQAHLMNKPDAIRQKDRAYHPADPLS
ncbi:MAG: hypothetical protein R2875_11035 [Desulfobacterales bacterium]